MSMEVVATVSESLWRDGEVPLKKVDKLLSTSIDFQGKLASRSEISTGGVGHFFPGFH